MVAPCLVTLVVTSTPIHVGRLAGARSNPGEAVQPAPSPGWTPSAKPLKLAGAGPPLRRLARPHRWRQKGTAPAAERVPTTNVPPAGRPYSTTGAEDDAAV